MEYCGFCQTLLPSNLHKMYHDQVHGFPVCEDNELFGRLILEINQAGLSWDTILKKQQNFRQAYAGFDILKIAAFTSEDEERLLADQGIIRNKSKINAVIFNAQMVSNLVNKFGSFYNWLDYHHPISREEWNKLFKKTFKFVGMEIVNEFLTGVGFLPGAHSENCPVYSIILAQNPKWSST
jgi:DNA-3-methyladenine glycosylase I